MDELPRTQLRNVLGKWRNDLIDLTGRNRLLNFRHTRTATLAIRSPQAGPLLTGLDAGLRFAPLPEDDAGVGTEDEGLVTPADTTGIVTQKSTQPALDSALRRLYRDSNQMFNDTGLWTLQLGVAFLKWREPGAEGFNQAPLLLVPVRLDRLGPGLFRLVTEQSEDAAPNPALAVKMGQLGLDWPDPDGMKDLPGTLAAVRAAVAGHRDWEVTEDVVLATFRSHKEAMYRDLLDHEDQILAHPLVQAIGLGEAARLPDDALYFDPLDADRIDELQPPELTPLVLDADSSQRQCVAAALDGRSFIMDGPPGTGKSQTIANMIAALMHQGRSVLFVSEKAAALDVVRNRLDAVGLGAFVLALHSHHASRKEVAKTLGDALAQRPKAVRAGADEDRQRLLRTRRELSAYAAAMNETRPPLGLTLHEVIGRLSALADVPPLPTALPDGLTAEGLRDIRTAAERLGDAWRPIAEGTAFMWRDLTGGGHPQTRLELLRERAESLQRRLAAHTGLTEPLGLAELGAAERLLTLLDATAGRPDVPEAWLTAPDLPVLRAEVADFTTRLAGLRASLRAATDGIGATWDRLPADLVISPTVDEAALAELPVEGLDLSGLTEGRLRGLATQFQETALMLRDVQAPLADIAAVYGMPTPDTTDQALALCRLTDFARQQDRPEAAWLTRDGRIAAASAAAELEHHVTALVRARAAADRVFTENILGIADFPAIVRRFIETRGIAKISASHRDDKRLLAGMTVRGEWSKEAAERLPQALAWYEAAAALNSAAASKSPVLGRYWQGEHTDFPRIRALLNSAEEIAHIAGGSSVPPALARQVCADGRPDAGVHAAADQVRERLDRWRRTLVPAPQPGGRPRLATGTLADAAAWYTAHLGPLAAGADLIAAVQPVLAASGPLTFGQARRIAARVEAVRAEREAFLARRAGDEQLLGPLYAGLDTDPTALGAALDWVAGVRSSDEPMPERAARALLSSGPDEELRTAWSAFRAAATDFVQLFGASRRPALQAGLTGTPEAFAELTDRFAADRSGPDEWRSFRDAREVLRRHGLDGLIVRAAEKGLDGAVFSRATERAVLEAWAEQTMAADSRLTPVRAVERDKLVELFRDLDRALVANAHAQVIEACNARRPRPNVGQAAVIQREAEKKSRHMPVRTLLDRTPDIVPLVKPCFMMSPLTVSQFLPPGYRFDVVIFDEASQVLPQDAVNCVYRGDSLIVAGDQKQLPPTDFFAQSDDSGDDEYDEDVPDSFDSLLDMCKGSGLIRSLPLSWHYRSRHEGLIAFSNRRFYGGGLVTFPGAFESGDDVGVTFTKVPGVYERGRSRRNPIEADAVAERVLHHYRTRPHLSLGVVAMSDAQAHAIEDAVERARAGHPELERFFAEDRLNGFFVKNLETVQGDERDVVIISVGYGRGPDGRLTMAFGPLNRENGWRRLNVAVTRARRRVEVISSISGSEIREGTNRSLDHFKRYLDYAEHGPAVLEQGPLADDAAPESPFEESVLDVLRDWGYDVQPQVGVGGYRIDMAVRHPALPGRFALGIECDGAMYHSSKAARDRDRLREEVLRGLGWKLYRIWGTDWYRNRPEAEARLREAVESAIALMTEKPEPGDGQSTAESGPEPPWEAEQPRVTMEPAAEEQERGWAARYRRARVEGHLYYYEMHVPESRGLLQRIFREVLDIEAPVQRDVLYRRAATVWGVERLGARIRANLDKALGDLLRHDPAVEQDGETITLRGRETVPREPGDGVLRRVAEVPPRERRLALLGVIGESPGMTETELTTHTARFFGWNRRGPDIARAFSEDLVKLQTEGLIDGLPDRIVLR
jgi:very-short-patch-repair endonuclease